MKSRNPFLPRAGNSVLQCAARPVTQRKAFSLVEVTFALGIVSFTIFPLVALLPMGLQSVRDSATETSLSGIVRQVRAELNQADFAEISNNGTGLSAQTWYFDEAGLRLPNTKDSFFKLKFTAANPEVEGQAADFEQSAKAFILTVKYPAFAPTSSQTTNTFAILVARQTSR